MDMIPHRHYIAQLGQQCKKKKKDKKINRKNLIFLIHSSAE